MTKAIAGDLCSNTFEALENKTHACTREDIHVVNIYHSYCDHMKTSNPALRLRAAHWVSGYADVQEERKKERETAKKHNDRLDDVHVHPFELVTLHKLRFHMQSLHSPTVFLWSVSTSPRKSKGENRHKETPPPPPPHPHPYLNTCNSDLRRSLRLCFTS